MADFLLSVGVDVGLSYDQMQKDISNLVSQLNSNPPRIRVDLDLDTAAVTNLRTQISDLYNTINSTGTTTGGGSGGFRRATENAREHTIALRTVIDTYTRMHALMNNNTNAHNISTWSELSDQAQRFAAVLELVESQNITVNEALHQLGINGTNFIENARIAMSAFSAEIEHTGTSGSVSMNQMYSLISQMQTLLNNNTGAAGLTTYTELQNRVTLFSQAIQYANTESISLEAALRRVGLSGATAIEDAKTAISAFRAEVSGATLEESNLSTGTNEYYSSLRQVSTLLDQVTRMQERWTAARTGSASSAYNDLSIYAGDLRTLEQQVRSGSITLGEFRTRIAEIRANVSSSANAIRNAGEATRTWSQRIGSLSAKFGTWFSITRVIMAAYRAVRQMVTNVIELDTAMTELKKVTNESDATYENFLTNATHRAKKLGATLSDTVNASADFARLGFGIEDSEKLADAAIVYKNVGDGIDDIGAASESIIATMQAFAIPADQVMSIVDRFNEVGNNFAISSKGVGDALLRSAAALHAANNTLDESIALAAAANTIVQDPEKVGTTLKTVSMYLRASKTDAESAGEATDGMADSISELRKEILSLTGNKVDIQLDENNFKSTYQILKELSVVWKELSDISQANLLEMIGGKRNSNVVSALLENFSVAEKAITTSAHSAGSAVSENEKVLDSLQGKLNILKSTFQETSKLFISDNFLGGAIKGLTGFLNILNSVITTINTPIGKMIASIALVNTALAVSGRLWQAIRARSIVADILSIGVAERSLGTAIQIATGHLGRQIAQWALSPFGMATIAVAGITLITSAIEKHSQKLEENAQKASESFDKLKSDMNELDDLIKKYNDLQISNEWNNTTIEEKKKLQEDINKLLGDEADKIDIINGKYEETTKELFKQRMDKVSGEEREASNTEKAKGASLWDTVYWNGSIEGTGGYNYGKLRASEDEKKYIKKYNNVFEEKDYTSSGDLSYTDYVIRFKNYDDFMAKYKEVQKMLQDMYDNGMEDSNLYKGLNDFIKKFDTKVNEHEDAIKDYNEKKSIGKLKDYIDQNAGGYIDDLNEYKKTVGWIEENFTGENKDSVLGFLNSYFSEYADKIKEASEDVDVSGLTTLLSEYKQMLADEYKKVTEWGLDSYLQEIKDGSIQSTFGNVDMDKRTIISWSDELKKTYQDALASWEYDPKIGSIDTVFGGSDRFGEDLNGIGWEVAFTPILPDGTFLSKDTVYEYINNILAGAYGNDNQVTEEELKSIDAQGRQIGETFVKGIFAGVDDSQNYDNNGNWAETVSRLMHFSGNFGAVEIAQKGIVDTSKAIERAIKNANKVTVPLSDLTEASESISSLSSAFKQLSEDGYITTDTVSKIKEATKLSDEEWDNYEQKLLKAKAGSAEFNQILSELTYKILENKLGTNGLANATEEQIAAVLRENGVVNANAVAHEIAAKNKLKEKIQTALLQGNIESLNGDLLNEAKQCGLTADSFRALAIQMVLVNNTKMSFDQQIAALKSLGAEADLTLAKVAGVSGYKNSKYSQPRGSRQNVDRRGGLITSVGQELINGQLYIVYYGEGNKVIDKEKVGGLYSGGTTIDYSGALKDSKNSGSKNEPDYKDPTEAVIRAIRRNEEDINDALEDINNAESSKGNFATNNDKMAWNNQRIAQNNALVSGYAENIKMYNDEIARLNQSYGYDTSSWFDTAGELTVAYYNLYNSSSKTAQETLDKLSGSLQNYHQAVVKDNESMKKAQSEAQKLVYENYELAYESYKNLISHKESMGDYYNQEEKHLNDLLWASKNFVLSEEMRKQLDEEIYSARLSYQEKEIENTQKLVKAHQEELRSFIKVSERAISDLEHLRDMTPEREKATRAAFEEQIANIRKDNIAKAEKGMADSHTNADYWRKQLNSKLSESNLQFDIEKWFDVEGNLTETYENDLKNITDETLEKILRGFAENISEQKQGWIELYDWLKDENQAIFDYEQGLLSSYLDDYERIINDLLDLRIKKLQSESSLLKEHHDLINKIAEEQNNLNKELKEAETVGARMSKQERDLLFNKEDYSKLSEKLNSVLSDANKLQSEYNRALSTATADTIDEITSNYERQYNLKMKEYEIVKAELDVFRAQQKLENVQNEKSVRVWNGSRWIHEAVLQDVIDAQNQLEDAKFAYNQSKIQQAQQSVINGLDSQADALETEKNQIATSLKEMNGELSSTIYNLNESLKNIRDTDVETFSEIIKAVGGKLKDLFGIDLKSSASLKDKTGTSLSYDKNTDYLALAKKALSNGNEQEAERLLSIRDAKIEGENLKGIVSISLDTLKSVVGHKNGILSSQKGLAKFDEEGLGSEVIITSDGVFRQFDWGDTVFSKEMVKNLWNISKTGVQAPEVFIPTSDFSNLNFLKNKDEIIDNSVHINGIEITDREGKDAIRSLAEYFRKKY